MSDLLDLGNEDITDAGQFIIFFGLLLNGLSSPASGCTSAPPQAHLEGQGLHLALTYAWGDLFFHQLVSLLHEPSVLPFQFSLCSPQHTSSAVPYSSNSPRSLLFLKPLENVRDFSMDFSCAVKLVFLLLNILDLGFGKLLFPSLLHCLLHDPLTPIPDLSHSRFFTWSSSHLFLSNRLVSPLCRFYHHIQVLRLY